MERVWTRAWALAMKSATGVEPWSPLSAGADADRVSFGFLVAHDEDVGRLLVGEVADFAVHLFVAVVEFDAEAGGLRVRL
jgi:hypothetical protein